MVANKPAGPTRFLVVMFLIGLGLMIVAFQWPSVHSLWQVIVGGPLAIFSLGRMVSR